MNTKAIGYVLVGLVLLIEIPRFYGTYADLDPLLLGLPLTAIGTGIVLPVGAGYVFHAWWATTRKRREWLLVAFVALLVLEGAILVPWGMARLQAEPLASVVGFGWLAWGWVSVVMLSPFVVVGAVVMAMAFQKQNRTDTSGRPPTRQSVEAEMAAIKPFVCGLCGADFDSQAALNGHQNAHRTNGNERSKEHDATRLVEPS